MSGEIIDCHNVRGATGIQEAEVKYAAVHLTMHRRDLNKALSVGPWLRDLGVDTWDQIPALLCGFCLGFPSYIIWDSTSANLVG